MHENYEDILDRINEPPSWYDQNGTPRYGDFHPNKCPNIYSRHVGLFLIACQDCNQQFKVEMHADIWGKDLDHPPAKWHYGDPPIHGCVGDTMNCEDLAVLEFWTNKPFDKEWVRRPEFEGLVDDTASNNA